MDNRTKPTVANEKPTSEEYDYYDEEEEEEDSEFENQKLANMRN